MGVRWATCRVEHVKTATHVLLKLIRDCVVGSLLDIQALPTIPQLVQQHHRAPDHTKAFLCDRSADEPDAPWPKSPSGSPGPDTTAAGLASCCSCCCCCCDLRLRFCSCFAPQKEFTGNGLRDGRGSCAQAENGKLKRLSGGRRTCVEQAEGVSNTVKGNGEKYKTSSLSTGKRRRDAEAAEGRKGAEERALRARVDWVYPRARQVPAARASGRHSALGYCGLASPW